MDDDGNAEKLEGEEKGEGGEGGEEGEGGETTQQQPSEALAQQIEAKVKTAFQVYSSHPKISH